MTPFTHPHVRALAAEAYSWMAEVLEQVGTRESCGEGERKLGELLAERWRALGLTVRSEPFLCHPTAFLGFIPVAVVLYLAAVASFWRWPWLCALASALALTLTTFELLRYRELIDPLFPTAEGENVVGILSPEGEVRRRVVVSAHRDAAYEFNLWLIFRNAAVLLATSAEEAGLRGAKRFVAAHRAELHATPTYGLFVDGVYDERFLTVMHRELAMGVRHDPRLVALAQRAAQQRGREILRSVIPLGGTDAAPFSLAGVPSIALLCQQTSSLAPNYHTRHDTLEKVRPESLETMLQLVLDLIDSIDGGELDDR